METITIKMKSGETAIFNETKDSYPVVTLDFQGQSTPQTITIQMCERNSELGTPVFFAHTTDIAMFKREND